MTHDRLVEKATNFLKYQKNCSPVLSEHHAVTAGGETPDVIGWKWAKSYLVECKTSRGDFFRDANKRFKGTKYAMGRYRYYFVPKNLVSVDEIPDNWGLVYLEGRSYKEIITCDHSLLDNPDVVNTDNPVRWNEPTIESLQNEIRMLT